MIVRKIGVLVLAAVLGASILAPAGAQEISVVIDGNPVAFDQPPIERADHVFVPLRGIFERLGATVDYSNGTILANRGDTTVALHIGSTLAYVDGDEVQLDAAPFVVGDRTLVPLRFIAEALGAVVDWNQEEQTVYVDLTAETEQPPPPDWPPPYPQVWPPPTQWWPPYQRTHSHEPRQRAPRERATPTPAPTPSRLREPRPVPRTPMPVVTPVREPMPVVTPVREPRPLPRTPMPVITPRVPLPAATARPAPIPHTLPMRTPRPRVLPTPTGAP